MEITGKVLIVLLTVFLLGEPPWLLCYAQPQDEAARGIQLYRDGKMKEAVSVLRAVVKKQKDNADAWHYLGMAQHQAGDTKSATISLENAIRLCPKFVPSHSSLAVILFRSGKLQEALRKAYQTLLLDPQNQDAHYIVGEISLRTGSPADALKEADAALKVDDRFQAAWLLKSQAWLGLFVKETLAQWKLPASEQKNDKQYERYNLLGDAAVSLESFLKLNQNAAENEFWSEQLEAMRFYVKYAEERRTDSKLQPKTTGSRPIITYRERAAHAQEARDAGESGTVQLLVFFADDGQLKYILVLQGLGHGLTQEAVKAARKVKFIPAMKDGKPVSVPGNIEYNFPLY